MSRRDFAVGVLVGGIAGMLTGIVISKINEENSCVFLDSDDDTSNEIKSENSEENEISND